MTTVATTNPQEAKAAPNPQEAKVAENPQEVRSTSGRPALPRPDLNGRCIALEGHPEIFLVLNGFLRLVPDWETFQRLFANAPIDPYGTFTNVTKGAPLSKGAMLVRGKDINKTYLLTDNVKMWIPNTTIFEQYHFDMSQCEVDSQIVVDYIPEGPNVEGPHR